LASRRSLRRRRPVAPDDSVDYDDRLWYVQDRKRVVLLMSIPAFQKDGLLPPGIWQCTGEEFNARFCDGKHRKHFAKAAQDIFDFALSSGSTRVLIGGSFIANTKEPNDLDCVVVFEAENQIPDRTERLAIEGTRVDVFFCAED
jgi:hypothetical protein